jgi:hypothetical protein
VMGLRSLVEKIGERLGGLRHRRRSIAQCEHRANTSLTTPL